MRRMFRALRALALCAGLAAAACSAAPTPVETAARPAPTTTAELGIEMPDNFSDWLRGHYTERVLMFHTYAPLNGEGVAFVGDSITEGGDWAAAFPGVETRNYGISGDTTWGVEARLAQVAASRPAKVFLLIGTNDLGNHDATPDEIAAHYAMLLDRFAALLPDARLYVQAVLPREPRNAETMRQINERVRALAAARGLTFVDIYTPFAGEGGRLDPSVTEDDLHLTAAGYERWRVIIDPLVRAR